MKNKTLIIGGVLLIVILLIVATSISPKEEKIKENLLGIDYKIDGNETKLKYETENPVVAMYIKNYGSIIIELYPDVAPNTVNNFISLIKKGFYDNNSFHRLVPGFVLQGGDPDGTGMGGPGYSINGEFTSNGFENNLSHKKWIVSMARSNDPNSAGSQFFICVDDATNLDGEYAAFGKVIDGFKNIEKIVDSESIADQNSGKLVNNLVIKKTLIDFHGKEYDDVIKSN